MKKIILSLILFLCFAQGASGVEFLEKSSTHFIVYYKDVSEEFINTVLEFSEKYYDALTEKLGFTRYDYWTWEKRAKIYVYADQDAFVKEMKQPQWSGGVASYEQKTIWTFPREAGFFDTLLPHEIAHIIFREVIGGRHVPLWLEEGVASYLEQAKRFGSKKIVTEAMKDGTFIPFDELSKIDVAALKERNDANLFYAESVNIISFMIDKFGASSFNEFCRRIKDRRSFDDALTYSYFDIRSASDLGKFWEQSLKDEAKIKSGMIL